MSTTETQSNTSNADQDTSDDQRQAYHTAIKMLSAREHSAYELTQKLSKRGYSGSIIDHLLQDLQSSGYQSDERFAEQYARQRLNKGYGPLSIRAKLAERGIESSLASNAIDGLGVDWLEHATHVISRKFTAENISSTEAKFESRIARFLQSRGFSSSIALRALKDCRQSL